MARYTTYSRWIPEFMLKNYEKVKKDNSMQSKMFLDAYEKTICRLDLEERQILHEVYIQKIPKSEVISRHGITKGKLIRINMKSIKLLALNYGFIEQEGKK